MTNVVGWFEIYVDDMARAQAFYEAVLGVTLQRVEGVDLEMWRFPAVDGAPGSAGALAHVPGYPLSGVGTIVYFDCEDCAIEGARVEAAGGELVREKMAVGAYGFVCLARDTEGNMIGLRSDA